MRSVLISRNGDFQISALTHLCQSLTRGIRTRVGLGGEMAQEHLVLCTLSASKLYVLLKLHRTLSRETQQSVFQGKQRHKQAVSSSFCLLTDLSASSSPATVDTGSCCCWSLCSGTSVPSENLLLQLDTSACPLFPQHRVLDVCLFCFGLH